MRNLTKIILAVTLVLLIGYDIVAYFFGKNATISIVITDFSYYTPWVPFIFGFVMGHFFWPAKGSKD